MAVPGRTGRGRILTTAAQPVPAFSFDVASHTYRDENNIVVPSVTQLLKSEGFINFDGIPEDVLERKRRLGAHVHYATQLWDQGEDLSEWEIPSAVMEYTEGYFNFVHDTGFQPELVESRKLATVYGMRYGMTLDRRGELQGEMHILELKCGANESAVWGLQLAAYDLGVKPAKERPRDRRAALQLGPQFSRGYKLHPYDDPGDYTVWVNALANDVWKRNHKIAQYAAIPERLG